jgi:hypothetical protein
MKRDILGCGLEEVGHVGLSQPDRFILQPYLDARPAVFCLIKKKVPEEGRSKALYQVNFS